MTRQVLCVWWTLAALLTLVATGCLENGNIDFHSDGDGTADGDGSPSDGDVSPDGDKDAPPPDGDMDMGGDKDVYDDPCASDKDCAADFHCDPCGASSCPNCEDCLPVCVPHHCVTGSLEDLTCNQDRPECGEDAVAVVENGCWKCRNLGNCEPVRDEHCDDGTEPTCQTLVQPTCESYEILAHRNNCYACVNPATCVPWGTPACSQDADCLLDDFCDPCGSSSCPSCKDCVPACGHHGCDTEAVVSCGMARPECGENGVAVVVDGCWECLSLESCEPMRNDRCDDGSVPTCEMMTPVCEDWEILAYQNDCYRCVNPQSCVPWGEAGCRTDLDCKLREFCNPCGTSSCPSCLDCMPACARHECETDGYGQLNCESERPDCGAEGTAVIRNGCWVCVNVGSCEEISGRDTRCDDGTEPMCNMIPPVCDEWEILAHQLDCYSCVNPATCLPWGVPGCENDDDCRRGWYCDGCASSSCPECDDCLAACRVIEP